MVGDMSIEPVCSSVDHPCMLGNSPKTLCGRAGGPFLRPYSGHRHSASITRGQCRVANQCYVWAVHAMFREPSVCRGELGTEQQTRKVVIYAASGKVASKRQGARGEKVMRQRRRFAQAVLDAARQRAIVAP